MENIKLERKTVETAIGRVAYVEADKSLDRQTVVVLDVSSSMGWTIDHAILAPEKSRIEYAKEALNEFMNTQKVDKLIVFSDSARTISPSDIETITARGGTNFENAIRKLSIVMRLDKLNIVVFITDGEVETWDSDKSLKIMQNDVKSGFLVQFNCIGIGASEELLLRLAQCGLPGTVQNINDSKDIIPAVEEVGHSILISEPLNVVETKDGDAPGVDIADLDTVKKIKLYTALLQYVSKLPVREMSAKLTSLGHLLDSLKLDRIDSRPLKLKTRLVLNAASNALTNSAPELVKAASKLFNTVDANKPKDNIRANEKKDKLVIANYELALKYMDPKRKLKVLITEDEKASWQNFPESCIVSLKSALEAAEEDNPFCVAFSREDTHSKVRSLDPENTKICFHNMFMTLRDLLSLYEHVPPNGYEKGVLPNTGGQIIHGAIPIMNCTDLRPLMQLMDALAIHGHPMAFNIVEDPIIGLLMMWGMISSKSWNLRCAEDTWKRLIERNSELVSSNFDKKVAIFGKPYCRTPDKIPALSVFLMRCIVRKKLSQDVVKNLMIEFLRRKNRKRNKSDNEAEKWKLVDFWKTNKLAKDEHGQIDAGIQKIKANWRKCNWNHNITLRLSCRTECTLADDVIEKRMKTLHDKWNKSKLWLSIKRFQAIDPDKQLGDLINPFPCSLTTQEKHKFLVLSMQDSYGVKHEKKPNLWPKWTPNIISREVISEDATFLHKKLVHMQDRVDAMVFLSQMTDNELGTIRKIMKRDPAHGGYKFKWGLVASSLKLFALRGVTANGEIEFRHVPSPHCKFHDICEEWGKCLSI